LGGLGEWGIKFMGHAQESSAATPVKVSRRAKRKAWIELEELREENKQLRETVAHLSELVLNQIAGQLNSKSTRLAPKDNHGSTHDSRIASAIGKVFARVESRVSKKLARLRS
jgi:hypothetical protein